MTQETPTEERIEEMLEIERELADQYEEHRTSVETSDPEPEPSGEDDSPTIPDHVGIVERFTLDKCGEIPVEILFGVITNEGREVIHVSWPTDPTDRSEELVRLCEYLGVSVDRLADIQGKEVPLWNDPRGNTVIHIPPIQTTGNALKYRIDRFLRRKGVLTWTDGIEQAQKRYAEENTNVSFAAPKVAKEREHRRKLRMAQDIVDADSKWVDDYPCKVNPVAAMGGALVTLIGLAGAYPFIPYPGLPASFSQLGVMDVGLILATVVSGIAVFIIAILMVVVLYHLARGGAKALWNKLFPKAD